MRRPRMFSNRAVGSELAIGRQIVSEKGHRTGARTSSVGLISTGSTAYPLNGGVQYRRPACHSFRIHKLDPGSFRYRSTFGMLLSICSVRNCEAKELNTSMRNALLYWRKPLNR